MNQYNRVNFLSRIYFNRSTVNCLTTQVQHLHVFDMQDPLYRSDPF
jgi:hypothetical protein